MVKLPFHKPVRTRIPKLLLTPKQQPCLSSPSSGTPSQNPGWMMSQTGDLTAAKEPGISVAWKRGEDISLLAHPSMSVVKSIELVLPKDAVYLAGSCIKGQVLLTLNSTLVDPIVKVELMGKGYVEWSEESGASRDYSRDVICNNKAEYVHKTKTFPVEGKDEAGSPP